ncbi:MAG: ABC transporter substrate-binding protein [Rhodobacteraceae bacterium]|nr:ABC transporter substrate-binding protein [Paracoccaceae bacterium]
MKFTKLASFALAAVIGASPVLADLEFPSISYRTGPFGANGAEVADGWADYMTLLNERDGGVGGVRINAVECETGFNAEKTVECYEATKGDGALVYAPLSTAATYQLIPRVTADGIPLHSMGYGRTSVANGDVFSQVFNFPANYWNAASVIVNHLLDINDGSLEGKTIALAYHNSAFGKEPIPTLEALGEMHGFDLTLLPIDSPGQEQKSQWLQIRREKPDYVVIWGWGVMNQVAIQEAANIRYPMENFIGVWWSGSDNDVIPSGMSSDGYKAVTFHAVGTDFPVFDDIQKYVTDAGLSAGTGANVGTILYNRGLYQAALLTESVRVAQEMHGVADITAAMMRDGMENLVINDEVMGAIGLAGFGPSFEVSCENHGGPGLGAIQQWDATAQSWSLITEFSGSDMSVIQPLIDADSSAYAAENNIESQCN